MQRQQLYNDHKSFINLLFGVPMRLDDICKLVLLIKFCFNPILSLNATLLALVFGTLEKPFGVAKQNMEALKQRPLEHPNHAAIGK